MPPFFLLKINSFSWTHLLFYSYVLKRDEKLWKRQGKMSPSPSFSLFPEGNHYFQEHFPMRVMNHSGLIWRGFSWYSLCPAAAAAKSLQSCLTLCDPIDGSPPGSPVPGILQAGTLEWVAISFSNAWKWKGKVKLLSRVQLLATPWTIAHQALPSMGFSRQEYWSGVPLSLCPRSDIINICCIFDNTYKYL